VGHFYAVESRRQILQPEASPNIGGGHPGFATGPRYHDVGSRNRGSGVEHPAGERESWRELEVLALLHGVPSTDLDSRRGFPPTVGQRRTQVPLAAGEILHLEGPVVVDAGPVGPAVDSSTSDGRRAHRQGHDRGPRELVRSKPEDAPGYHRALRQNDLDPANRPPGDT
jgi:hypothetical protein